MRVQVTIEFDFCVPFVENCLTRMRRQPQNQLT